ncbi:glycosyltransferase [Corallococcus exiguus]|uniref:Glycosyltransferase n=1 Tax=Corallococcus exiguus TaxID=83462 RepID=A0A7X4Y6M8_9BACT|nr:glycosyltransferase [Corallococcus exiguus]TNV63333.1 glycosyltransferase family 2 protein [Corallococcus exiguus]
MSGPASANGGGPGIWLGIVLYRNPERELERLWESLRWNREVPGAPAFRVVWMDNSPDDTLRARVARLDAKADYRHAGRNLGFGAAHNRLMTEAFGSGGARYYVCVNPDGLLHPDCVRELARVADQRADTGLVEARLFPDEHPKPYHPATGETPWCSGCVLLVTKKLHATVGGFDERFFMYCEDVDLSWRARASGLSIRVAPSALVHHYTVTREESPVRERMVRRSAALLGAKYGDAAFTNARLREYAQLGGEPFQTPDILKPGRRLAGIADFRHHLEFARRRW